MILYNILMTCLFFIVLPLLYGQLWKNTVSDGMVFQYISGFFTVLAVFEIAGIPMVLTKTPFHIQMIVYSVLLLGLAALSFLQMKTQGGRFSATAYYAEMKDYIKKLSRYEWVYVILLAGVLLGTVYVTAFCDLGGWTSDDGTYVVLSTAGIFDDIFYYTDEVTGELLDGIYMKYAFSELYVFYAYASVVTGLGVAVIEHSICSVLFLLMAYGTFYLLSRFLFPKDSDRDNRMIFLIFLSVLYLFGLYSHYSLTFRLFGVIWQGKAILAVVMIPFLLAVVPKYLDADFTWKNAGYMGMISLAAMSLSMGALLPVILIPGILCGLSALQKKQWKELLYCLPVMAFPLLIGGCYFLMK